MKEIIIYLSNQGVNFDVIFSDLMPVFLAFAIFSVFVIAYNNKGSRERYNEVEAIEEQVRLEKELNNARDQIAVLSISNELFAEQVKALNKETEKLSEQLMKAKRPRDEKGHYLKTSGKGHGRKKVEQVEQVEQFEQVTPIDRDWTKASKDELLAEAKRRYPIGTKFIPVSWINNNPVLREMEFNDIYSEGISAFGEPWVYSYSSGQWAKIV